MGLSVVILTFLLCSVSVILPLFIEAADTIKQGESLTDGETLISSGGEFELGFFSPVNSDLRYVGIWYKQVSLQTIVWIANRNSPVSGRNGSLTIDTKGDLAVLDQKGTLLWSSNVSSGTGNATGTLTDTGNLVLSSSSSSVNSKPLWQSFQNPTDSFLPGMVLHMNASNGENHLLRPWKSDSDPSVGNYSTGIDTRGTPQVVTWLGSKRIWRSGHWNGLVFLGVPSMRSFHLDGFRFDKDQDGSLDVTYTAFSNETMRFYLVWNGSIVQQFWNQTMKIWKLIQIHPANQCEEYNKCGHFGVCTGENSASCRCIKGFRPKNSDEWNRKNWSGGCVRKTPKLCEDDGFATMEKVKLPDFATVLAADSKADCEEKCLKNCSCNGYAFVTGIQCMMWDTDLVDVQHFADVGETMYVRLNKADLGGKMKLSTGAIIGTAVAAGVVLIVLLGLLWWFRARLKGLLNPKHKGKKQPPLNPYGSTDFSKETSGQEELGIEGKVGSGSDLPMYSFSTIAVATNDFANKNKLGQGGFGPVYKGILPGGQEVAVKRLSRLSGQGLEEFKNEIILIAKLQHRHLVRLLGCSIEGEEKLLIYEYMPNKSLDFLLFDHSKEEHLDWKTRNSIIEGVARGLLYLHRDSRLRIIHRDMKASNILLDEEMNPKISDFGMARMFGGNDNEANTVRVVGTYGYMAPEYAMEGLFSVKSDVYSFGVLLLEIVSGRKNSSFRTNEFSSLIRYSWNLWLEGKAMELVDPSIADSCNKKEVLRCIHVAMLCVQDSATNRPTMSSVVLMLESEVSTLPVPKQPTFSSLSNMVHSDLGLDLEGDDTTSTNNVTITQSVGGR